MNYETVRYILQHHMNLIIILANTRIRNIMTVIISEAVFTSLTIMPVAIAITRGNFVVNQSEFLLTYVVLANYITFNGISTRNSL